VLGVVAVPLAQTLGQDNESVALDLDLPLGPLRQGVALLDLLRSFLLPAGRHVLVAGGDGRVHAVGALGGSVAGRGVAVVEVAVGLEGLEVLWRRPVLGPRR
jgi:hypothetical protein